MCGIEILDLPCLYSRYNLNLTSEDMDDLWRQDISVKDDNDPVPKNISFTKNIPLKQVEK